MNRIKTISKLLILLRTIVLGGLLFVIIAPLYKMFIDTISNGSSYEYYLLPIRVSFRRYKMISTVYFKQKLLYHSFTLAFVCSIIQVLFAAISGYAFARLKFKGINIIFYLYLGTLLIPKQYMTMAYDALYKEYPLFGIDFFINKYSIYIMYLFGSGIKAPVFVYLFRHYFRIIPNSLIDQSQIDGCSIPKTFVKIAFPMALPAIIPTFILSFIWEYNDFYFPNYFSFIYDDFEVISTRLASGRMVGGANAAAFFMLIPVLLIYIFVEKYFLDNIKLEFPPD